MYIEFQFGKMLYIGHQCICIAVQYLCTTIRRLKQERIYKKNLETTMHFCVPAFFMCPSFSTFQKKNPFSVAKTEGHVLPVDSTAHRKTQKKHVTLTFDL